MDSVTSFLLLRFRCPSIILLASFPFLPNFVPIFTTKGTPTVSDTPGQVTTGVFDTSGKLSSISTMVNFFLRFIMIGVTPAVNLSLVSLTPVVKNDSKIELQPMKSYCLNGFRIQNHFAGT